MLIGLGLDGLPQKKIKPLTENEISYIGAKVYETVLSNGEKEWGIEFARAIEAAHNIK